MAVTPGSTLGPYEVLSFVGAGGMGEVYRARDRRLGRDVAIKVLRSDRRAVETARRRFLQEARAASSLNHPNIATIHDIASDAGTDFIVMEYVVGRPLSALVRAGMQLDEVLRLAIAIADALTRAHAAGIVHRDLKPANIVVASDGTPKILDFGLAKLVDPPVATSEQDTTIDETGSSDGGPLTALGGTPGYIAPEQMAGGRIDSRCDVFSFGSLLYEMVTGRRAFQGNSRAETMTKVMRDQPVPPSALVHDVPPHLERLILRCLRKDPDRRWQHMADVKVELQDIQTERAAAPTISETPVGRRRLKWLAAGGVGALAVAAVGLVFWPGRGLPPAQRLAPVTTLRGFEATPSFSPEGNQVAFAWDGEKRTATAAPNFDIWLTIISGSESRRLTVDPADDMGPSWSPDGRSIAFLRGTVGRPATIHLVSPLGGATRKLSDFPAAPSDTTWFRGAAVPQLSWSRNGQGIAVARARAAHETSLESGGIHLVNVQNGESRPLTTPAPPRIDRDPAFSPDGKRLAYASCAGTTFGACDIHVIELAADLTPRGRPRRLTEQDLAVVGLTWTPDGSSIVYGGALIDFTHLWKVAVDGSSPPERMEVTRGGLSPATVPGQNRLAFASRHNDGDIYRFEPGRPDTPVVSSSAWDQGPSYSPDGRRIAFDSGRSGSVEEIWIADADGSNPVQLTHGPGGWQGGASWSPDGRQIAFDSRGADGFFDIWIIDAGGGTPRRITRGPLNENLPSWSRDGRWIYYQEERSDGRDIWRIPPTGGQAQRVTSGGGFRAVESPDGRTLVFVRRDDDSPLFVQPVEGGTARQVVDCVVSRSLAAGPDGVYYVGCPLTRPVLPLYRLEPASGVIRLLGQVGTGGGFVPGMTVAPDGRHVLFSKLVSEGSDVMLIENYR